MLLGPTAFLKDFELGDGRS